MAKETPAMKQTLFGIMLMMVFVVPAMGGPIIDNGHRYCWSDAFGDQFDNYAEVARGDTITLEIWTNDFDGRSTHFAGCGARTHTWWDSAVVDGLAVTVDHTGTYFGELWPDVIVSNHDELGWSYQFGVYGLQWDEWLRESKLMLRFSYPILPTAPLGVTRMGLLGQMFRSSVAIDFFDDVLYAGLYAPADHTR